MPIPPTRLVQLPNIFVEFVTAAVLQSLPTVIVCRLPHKKNMSLISVTLDVLKLLKSRLSRPLQEQNMYRMSVTLAVLKLLKSMLGKREQPKNM